MKKTALLVVDFVNEFVSGNVKSKRALHTIKPVCGLITAMRKKGYPIIFVNDTHDEKDQELKIWGKHSMRGSKASKIIPEIKVSKKDIILEKHYYSAFFKTKLLSSLKKLKIDTLIIAGLYLNICVKFSIIDAYLNGYKVKVALGATDAFTLESYTQSIAEIKSITDAKFIDYKKLIKDL